MPTKRKTGFDRYFEQQMADRKFAAEYSKARAEIDATDKLIRELDGARILSGMSKAELARRIESKPEILRRLFTSADSNPTMDTVIKLVTTLGYHLELVPNARRLSGRRESRRSAAAREIRHR